jgi:thiamine pyrophosphate-dependent acetolactate synthase large subunit-like protein
MGGTGFRVKSCADMTRALKKAVKINDRPVIIHALMCGTVNVYPFIPPGGTVKDVILKGGGCR